MFSAEATKPLFGVPLNVAVANDPSHDGIDLPRLFRECVDYIEEHGKAKKFLRPNFWNFDEAGRKYFFIIIIFY